MIKPDDPRELAVALLDRSTCKVQVAAVLADKHGIFAWGWNSSGKGSGMHGEAHAISRASRRRMKGATIYVAGRRMAKGNMVCAMPCLACAKAVKAAKISEVWYTLGNGAWGVNDAEDLA